MEQNNPYAEYSSPALYDDGTGRGAILNPPIADPKVAMGNMQTLSPMQLLKKKKEGAEKQNMQEEGVDHLEALFDGEELSESFKEKAKTIFEAAINERVTFLEGHILQAAKEIIEEQQEAAKEVVQEMVEQTQEGLVENIDQYMDYVITEWMEENKVAVERGLRTEIAENFINGLKALFESSFIDVPNEKYDILDDLYGANEELQESVNKLIKENIVLKNEVQAHLCAEAFMEKAAGLADTQVEKLAKLAEGLEFENPEQYAQKVALLRESYFGDKKATKEISEQSEGSFVGDEPASQTNMLMEDVVNTLSFMNRGKQKVERVVPEKNQRLASLINPNFGKDKFI